MGVEHNIREQLTEMSKEKLADRIMKLTVLNYAFGLAMVVSSVLLITETKEKKKYKELYQTTIELNELKKISLQEQKVEDEKNIEILTTMGQVHN